MNGQVCFEMRIYTRVNVFCPVGRQSMQTITK